MARAVHAGKRRSTKRTLSPEQKSVLAARLEQARAVKAANQNRTFHPEENPMFPGYHTCIVPRLNPQDPKMASPIGAYLGRGYKVISEDPALTGHSDEVMLGIPLQTYLQREDERVAYHNGLLKGLMPGDMDIADSPEGGDVYFDRSQSGVREGDKISLIEAGASMGQISATVPED